MVSKKFESASRGVAPKILVVSDHIESGALWTYSLQHANFNVVFQDAFDQAIETWENEVPDMILVDNHRFEASVVNLVGMFRRETIIPILLLTYAISENQIIETYQTGVDDCIIKPIKPKLVIVKIQAWLRRTWILNPGVMDDLHVGNFVLSFSERTIKIGEKEPVRLTNLELRLMHLLMGNSGHTINYDEIIRRVWGYESEADQAALKNIVYRLRRKIELVPAQPEYLVTLPSIGYKFIPAQE
ncbi:MAG: response regulator transcription factor [Anaerolineales bacterium]